MSWAGMIDRNNTNSGADTMPSMMGYSYTKCDSNDSECSANSSSHIKKIYLYEHSMDIGNHAYQKSLNLISDIYQYIDLNNRSTRFDNQKLGEKIDIFLEELKQVTELEKMIVFPLDYDDFIYVYHSVSANHQKAAEYRRIIMNMWLYRVERMQKLDKTKLSDYFYYLEYQRERNKLEIEKKSIEKSVLWMKKLLESVENNQNGEIDKKEQEIQKIDDKMLSIEESMEKLQRNYETVLKHIAPMEKI